MRRDWTNSDLVALCAEWQERLRLQDWDVSVRFVKPWEMGPDRAAEVTRINAKKVALILILDPEHSDPNKISAPDIEASIVHELVHLHFACIDDFKGTDEEIYEQAVNAISLSLLRLKRSGPGAKQKPGAKAPAKKLKPSVSRH